MRLQRFETLLVIVCTLAVSASAAAQTFPPVGPSAPHVPTPSRGHSRAGDLRGEEIAILEQSLDQAAKSARRFRGFSGWTTLASGGSLLSLGIIRLVRNPVGNQIERGVGLLWLSIGATSLTTGIMLLSRPLVEEAIHRRWSARREQDGPLSEYEVGSYAGELHAAAEFRRRERRLVRWVSLSGSAAGVLALSLIPAMDALNRGSRRNVFMIGSIYTSVGLINFGTSFSETGTERAWNSYATQAPRPRSPAQLSLAPLVRDGGGGLALFGCF